MAKQYKTVHPIKYYKDYIEHDIRPDARTLDKFRGVLINVNTLKTANGSAIVKIGNTTVVCGIKAELAQPKAEEPNKGYLIPNVELPALCSAIFRPGPPSTEAQVTVRLVADILENFKCLDLTQLCIYPDRLVWVLYCDIVCLNHDGAVTDACFVALMAALQTVKLPEVQYEPAINSKVVLETNMKPLHLENIPLTATFSIFDGTVLLADPTSDEETLGTGTVTIAMISSGKFFTFKPGGTPLTDEQMEKCISLTKSRTSSLNTLLSATLEKNVVES